MFTYLLTNICAKNYSNRKMLAYVTAKNVGAIFRHMTAHSYRSAYVYSSFHLPWTVKSVSAFG